MATQEKTITRKWMRLDNMANLFPAIELFSAAPVYRVTIMLDREIDKDILSTAARDVLRRFPYYKVRLRKGLFWSYLEYNEKDPVIMKDTTYPCVGINYRKNNHYLFKIKYIDNCISLEIFHALTDGGGAIVFLKTLAAQYLRLCGENISFDKENGVWSIDEQPSAEESKDSFFDYYNKNLKSLGIKSPAYHFKGRREKQDVVNVISAEISREDISRLSKEYGLSVTELITAVYIYSLYNIQQKTKNRRPIRVSVPVNLRYFFPSQTMRNFTNFVICGITPQTGKYSFKDIVSEVHHSMRRGLIKNNLLRSFSGNVNSERNIFVRILPLNLKLLILSLIYFYKGENQYSGSFSNLGIIKFPADMQKFIKGFKCYLSPNTINTTNCGATCVNDKLNITFTRTIKESLIEREFFRFFVKNKINVKIRSGV
ncbi:MAG: hypothetical protein PHE12_04935 [Clostridia bacterium]|nr:hypothetical protein [Clostridia bacterium]